MSISVQYSIFFVFLLLDPENLLPETFSDQKLGWSFSDKFSFNTRINNWILFTS